VPPLSTFNDLDDSEYMKLVNNYKDNWSLRDESLKYCESDIKALHEILASFSKEIFNEYNLNITKHPTASSLAMGIFRGHHLDEDKSRIPLLKGHIHSEIRKAFYGGAVETYIPCIKKGYHYDVNSLFPAAMKGDMPVGNYTYTTEQDLNKVFGFSYVRVETPLNLKVPLLPYRDEDKILYPVGTWYGMYYTEILKDVVKYGYKITIIYSVNFEKQDLFSGYVDKLYEIKANSTGSRRAMAKLLLNSLYGRFGLKEIIDKTAIVSKEKAEEIYALYEVKEAYPLKDGYELIVYSIKPDLDNIQVLEYKKEAAKILSGLELGFNDYNSSIAIAAAITANAQRMMFKYKMIPGNPMVATDTDSGIFEKPLPDHMIGPELGKMKLEQIFSEGYFLAPKLYGYIKENGKTKVVAKGVGSNLSYDQIISLYNSDVPVEVLKEIWSKVLIIE